jgi:hypothetical protein
MNELLALEYPFNQTSTRGTLYATIQHVHDAAEALAMAAFAATDHLPDESGRPK